LMEVFKKGHSCDKETSEGGGEVR